MSSFSADSFMANLPEPILEDDHLRQLAEVAARVMTKSLQGKRQAAIYCRINELPESLLDILAEDLKVDWYDYSASLETKRKYIADSWYIHKRLGTTAAVERAISDVWPNSNVEEWFDYGGDPFHFRIILDATDTTNPIYADRALDAVRLFKPARAHLQDDIPIVRVSFGIVVQTSKDSMKYHVGICGTIPRVATHGDRSDEQIVIEDMARSEAYHSPVTGQMIAGTYPSIATHGQMENDGLLVGASASESTYTARPCGTSINSLM